ncbi:MAG: putative GH25 family protein [Planctomycetota bacterium]|jgi:uncharacterized GH25 family protein
MSKDATVPQSERTMNKDAIILSFMVAVVLAAGAVFFLFNQQDEDDGFVPADVTPVEGEMEGFKAKMPARVPSNIAAEFNRPTFGTGEGPRVVADEGLDESYSASITGKVVDPDAKGIPNAVVALCLDIGNARAMSILGEVQVAAVTDEDGNYSIDGIATDDRYAIRVEAEGHASKVEQCINLNSGDRRKQNFQLSRGAELKGLVTDMKGLPIPGAKIIIADQATRSSDPTMDIEKTAVTDPNGEFECAGLNVGYKRVSCIATGYGTKTQLSIQIFAGKEPKPVEFKLQPGGESFYGMVIDTDDELPVEGVIIRAQPIRTGRLNIPSMNYPPVKTDQDGNFILEGLQPGSYRMRFFGGKGYPLSGTMRTAKVPSTDPLVVKLDRDPSASGTVIDGETGLPIKRFKIFFARSENLVMASPQLSQKFEDEEGKFEYNGVQTKPRKMKDFYLHAVARGYAGGASKKLTLNARDDIDGVVIEMYRGATVTGKIVDSAGKPINNAELDLSPQMGSPGVGNPAGGLFTALISSGTRTTRRVGRTNENGEFKIENVQAGWYKLDGSHPRFADGSSEISIEVARSGEFSFPVLSLVKGGIVRGRVLKKSGDPEKGARVRLQAKGGLGAGRGYNKQTDSLGRFEIRNVRPGIYLINVVERGGAVDLGSMFSQALNPGQEIILGDGEERDVGDL